MQSMCNKSNTHSTSRGFSFHICRYDSNTKILGKLQIQVEGRKFLSLFQRKKKEQNKVFKEGCCLQSAHKLQKQCSLYFHHIRRSNSRPISHPFFVLCVLYITIRSLNHIDTHDLVTNLPMKETIFYASTKGNKCISTIL